jgi:hypothetical protein
MHSFRIHFSRLLLRALPVFFVASFSPVYAQEQRERRPVEDDGVVRIKTELVQTDVSVVDRQGRPVEGLGREQFELKVGGKPRSVSFFEPVMLPSSAENLQPNPPVRASAGASIAPDKEGPRG